MAGTAITGSAAVRVAALPGLDASSATGLEVARWAGRPAKLARMDRLCAVALVACDGALVDAGLSPEGEGWAPERTGIVLGTALGCHATNEAYYRGYLGQGGGSPRLFAYTLPSSPVGEITIHHRILGPTSTQVGGLGAAIDALAEAGRHLAAGRADRMIVAAADVATPLAARMGYAAQGDSAAALVLQRGALRIATASRFSADDPQGAARECVEAVRAKGHAVARLYAEEALAPELAHAPLPSGALAAAPLLALHEARAEGLPAVIVAVADPAGQAAAALVELRG